MASRVFLLLLLFAAPAFAGNVINSYIKYPPAGGGTPATIRAWTVAERDWDDTSLAVTIPTNSDGDILVAFLCQDIGGTWAVESGWTIQEQDDPGSIAWAVYTRTASSDSGSYTFDSDQSSEMVGYMIAVQDSDGYDTKGTVYSGTGSTHTITAVSNSEADSLALAFLCFDGGDGLPHSVSSGAGWTMIDDDGGASAGYNSSASFYDKDLSSASGSVDVVAATSTTDGGGGVQISINGS